DAFGTHHVFLGGRAFDSRNHDGTQPRAGQFALQLPKSVRRLVAHRLQRREAVLLTPAGFLLGLLGFRSPALSLFLVALERGFTLGLGACGLGGFRLFLGPLEGSFAFGLLRFQPLRLGLRGLLGARRLGQLPLAFLFIALAGSFAVGFRARFLGGPGLFTGAPGGFPLRLLGLQPLRLGLGGLFGARGLGELSLALLFLALAGGFALGLGARLFGGLGFFAGTL